MTGAAPWHADRRLRTIGGVLALGCVFVVLLVEPFHGPVMFSLAGSHGLDLGDIVGLPFLLLALWLLRGSTLHERLLRELDRAHRRGWEPMRMGLLAAGIGLLLVQVFREFDVSASVAHAGIVPAGLAAVGLFVMAVALTEPGSSEATFGVPLVVVLGVLGLGLLIDATDGPAGAVVGPTLLAVLLAVTLGRRQVAARWSFGILAVLLLVIDFAALVDYRFLEPERELDGGGLIRAGAIGVILIVVALLNPHRRAEHR